MAAKLLVAAAAALPIGVILGHFGRFGNVAINISNVGRAIPSFALLVLAVEAIGIGAIPAFIALVALGIPPIVTNSYLGMREVDPDVREAAVGMGMRGPLVRSLTTGKTSRSTGRSKTANWSTTARECT